MARTWLFLALIAVQAGASDDFFSTLEVDVNETSPQQQGSIDYRGYVLATVKYGLDTPLQDYAFERQSESWSQVRTDAFAEFRGSFTDALQWQLSGKMELDWLQWQEGDSEWGLQRSDFRLKDAFIDATFDSGVWVRAGHQVFSWGEAEGLSVIDVLSPVDSRAPGQAELQDIREQVPALLVSTPALDGKLSMVVTYRAGHNRYAEKDQDFYPYITLKDSGIDLLRVDPDEHYEYALRWQYQLNGADISVVAADVNSNELAVVSMMQRAGDSPALVFGQGRNQVVGASASRVLGSWLLKGELAHHWNQRLDTGVAPVAAEQNQWRSALVVEYSGIDDLLISGELNNIYATETFPLPTGQRTDRSETGLVFRMRQYAMNERLTHQLWLYSLDLDKGLNGSSIYRWGMDYELNDDWEIGMAAIVYRSNDRSNMLFPYQNNDSVNATLKYSF